YVGSTSVVSFSNTVVSSSTVSAPPNNGYTPVGFPGNVVFNGNPPYVTNASPLLLSGLGTNDAHALIDMPPFGESPFSTLAQVRFYNQAALVLLVSNTMVKVTIQQSVNGQLPGADPSPSILSVSNNAIGSVLPFLTVTNTFFDQRQQTTNLVTQLDLGRYKLWAATNIALQA